MQQSEREKMGESEREREGKRKREEREGETCESGKERESFYFVRPVWEMGEKLLGKLLINRFPVFKVFLHHRQFFLRDFFFIFPSRKLGNNQIANISSQAFRPTPELVEV